ncbi:MAG: hypothetical protein ACI3XA_04630 [Clostridia bacterium]
MNDINDRTLEELGEEFDKFKRDTLKEIEDLKEIIQSLKNGAVTDSGT